MKHEPMVIGNQDLEPPHSSSPVVCSPPRTLGTGWPFYKWSDDLTRLVAAED
jgi:hypothetical protein